MSLLDSYQVRISTWTALADGTHLLSRVPIHKTVPVLWTFGVGEVPRNLLFYFTAKIQWTSLKIIQLELAQPSQLLAPVHSPAEAKSTLTGFWDYDGLTLYSLWGALSFLIIVFGRHLRHRIKSTLLHALSGIFILLLALTLSKITSKSETSLDLQVGLSWATVALCAAQATLGITVMVLKGTLTSRTRTMIRLKRTHQLFGLLLLLATNVNCLFGMLQVGDGVRNLIYGQFVAMVFFLGLAEVVLRLRGAHSELVPELDPAALPTMSLDEFKMQLARGRKLCLYCEFVVDLAPLLSAHPGGRLLLERNVGREIGKYMFGCAPAHDPVEVHRHSKFAFETLESLVVGRVVMPRVYMRDCEAPDEECSGWEVGERSPVSRRHNRVEFKNMRMLIPSMCGGVQFLGQNFVLTTKRDRASVRYYAICNCMQPHLYQRYLEFVAAHEYQSVPKVQQMDLQDFEDEFHLELIMKTESRLDKKLPRYLTDETKNFGNF